MALQLELRSRPKVVVPDRSFLPSVVYRDCPDIHMAIQK
jgi:hypothetical protein